VPEFQRNDYVSYYEEAGSGEPLVLICGLSADVTVWRLLIPELAKHFRVVTLDNRGAGRSSAPDEPYTIQGMADDAIALLDHLQIASANVLGWSMGGVIAQSIALARPEMVKHLLLLGSFAAPDGMLKNAIRNWVNVRRSNMPYEQVVRHVARMVYSPTLANNEPAYEAFIQFMVNNPYRQSMQGFVRQAEALLEYTAPGQLSTLQVPTSVLVGEQDQLTPPYLSEELAALLPQSNLQVLAGAHSGFVEYPALYAQTVVELLRSG
jgi:pimeloyl-ACP methyl ester carboxylesterase